MNKIGNGTSGKKLGSSTPDKKTLQPAVRRNFDQEALAFHATGPARQTRDHRHQAADHRPRPGAVNFEFNGEMSVDVALGPERSKIYPFCKLTGPANILVMPGLHAANI